MSKLAAFARKTEQPSTENFALNVNSYGKTADDRDCIHGIRADTGEEVTVILRPYTSERPLKAPQALVKDFVAAEGDITRVLNQMPNEDMRRSFMKSVTAKTEPGGTIVVQRAYTEPKTGIVNAGWLSAAAKFPGHMTVLENVMLRVEPVGHKNENGRQQSWSLATAIQPERAIQVKSADDLVPALKEAFSGIHNVNARPFVTVRMIEGDKTAEIHSLLPIKKDAAGQVISATPGQAAKKFLESDNGKELLRLAGDPDISIEVIPGARMNLGPQSKAAFEKGAGLESVNRNYRFTKDDQNKTGYTRSVMVLTEAANGGHMYTTAMPLSNKPELFELQNVPSALFKGQSKIVQENKAVDVSDKNGAAQQASEASQQETASSDDGFFDDEDFSMEDVATAGMSHIPDEATEHSNSNPRMRA